MSQEIANLRAGPGSGDLRADVVRNPGLGRSARIVNLRAPFSSETTSKTVDGDIGKRAAEKL